MHPDPLKKRAQREISFLRKRYLVWSSLMPALLLIAIPSHSFAQRPFQQYDQLYRSEQSQRSFYGGYALTAEVAYRNAAALPGEGLQVAEANPLGLSFRLDYQFSQRLDLSAVVDAAGNSTRRGLSLSWLVFKYYERNEGSSFALRLAVDPSFDGRVGFPQIDIAWLSSSLVTPLSSTNFAFGLRRVRLGYEQWVLGEPTVSTGFVLHGANPLANTRNNLDVIYTRAFGWEFHMMFGYNFRFDPAGSNVFVSLLGQAGSYDLLETSFDQPLLGQLNLSAATSLKKEITTAKDYLGGVIWVRSGIEFNRPNFQILPYIGLPLRQWVPGTGEWPRSRRQVGVRFMLR
ncbi:MAG: hypothetical protein AB8G77_13545 [Rhodothermales bacterium]